MLLWVAFLRVDKPRQFSKEGYIMCLLLPGLIVFVLLIPAEAEPVDP